ncbi:MAG: phage/plasmid primase, P4 family [Ilumatobacteraceae bacterium]
MVRLARGDERVLTAHEDLDADPNLLNVRNGTIDLRTGELHPHAPDDLLTLQAPIRYDPTAMAPLWRACLERWQPDPELREYLQREAGAGATGHPTETLSIHFGDGGNGKSKFFGGIQLVLGDYATVPHKSLLVTQRHEQHETIKADLFRKRIAIASERKAVDVLDDEQVKSITGGDRMRARRMREDPWFFWPSHTMVVVTNFRPAIRGRDEGIWRRVRLIPWTVTIPRAEADIDLAAKLKHEAPGILLWLIEGARRFLADGFEPPASIVAATENYRADEDAPTHFVADCLVLGRGFVMSLGLTQELERWCRDQGLPAMKLREVTHLLVAAGCHTERRAIGGKKCSIWVGVSIPGDTAFSGADLL